MIKIEVSESIVTPLENVWAVLMDVPSWSKWWIGHKLESVQPGWQKGGKLMWNPGTPSTIFEYIPPTLLDWGVLNAGMEIHQYFKLNQKSDGTNVIYGFTIERGNFPPGGEAKQKDNMKMLLAAFKRSVETTKASG
jgi:hypothetical protein